MGFVTADRDDPLDSARVVVARLFLVVGVLGVVGFAITRDWRALALAGAAWTLWTVIRGVVDGLLAPFANMLGNIVSGASVASDPAPRITMEEETALLERHLAEGRPAHQQILTGIRLAEIYRTHQRDLKKAEALIASLCERYPDAQELRFVRRGA